VRVTEIYRSIQGETAWAGLPCTLVRTTGCDLRCSWCDTAYSFYGGHERPIDEIVDECRRLGAPLVLLTGGEPLLQKELPTLARALLQAGFKVMVETSGAHSIAELPDEVIKIVDVKTPGSGESHRMRWENLARVTKGDAVKFVLAGEPDYQFARKVIADHGLEARTEVLLSPVHGELPPATLVEWMLRDGLKARLNVQVHKYVWSKDARGV
jgi:7-carboxy-7-deazaguanine synthase